jgi:hypothetical protein
MSRRNEVPPKSRIETQAGKNWNVVRSNSPGATLGAGHIRLLFIARYFTGSSSGYHIKGGPVFPG